MSKKITSFKEIVRKLGAEVSDTGALAGFRVEHLQGAIVGGFGKWNNLESPMAMSVYTRVAET